MSNAEIVDLLYILAFIAFGGFLVIQGKDFNKSLTTVVDKVTTDTTLRKGAIEQVAKLPTHLQSMADLFLDVVNPLTKTTPGDLDDRSIAWLDGILTEAKTAKQAQKPDAATPQT